MAQTNFVVFPPEKRPKNEILKVAKEKDSQNARFHIPADTGAVLTLTGEFFEMPWTRGEGKDKTTGSILAVGVKEFTTPIPFGFFRTKVLMQEDGLKTFEAAFDKEASFEEIVNSIEKDRKIKVCRGDYVFPGRSSARSIDTIVWA